MAALARLILALFFVALIGCDRELDRPIEFVIPKNFSGTFVIIENAEYPPRISRLEDCYEIVVPPDGVVRTHDAAIFHRWHTIRARIEGSTVPVTVTEGGTTVFGDRRTHKTTFMWSFVGNDSAGGDAEKWLKDRGIDPYGGPAAP